MLQYINCLLEIPWSWIANTSFRTLKTSSKIEVHFSKMQIFGGAGIHDILFLGTMGIDILKTTHDSYVNF